MLQRIGFAAGAWLFLAFLAPVSQAAGSDFTDRLIVKFRDPATYTAAPSPELTSSAAVSAGVVLNYSHAIANGAHVLKIPQSSALTEVQAMADRMRANPDIDYAEPDQRMYIALVPNDTEYANQWHYKEYTTEIGGANLPAAWDISTGSTSIVAAVIDTGLVAHGDIDSNILDGSGRVVAGYDFISDLFVANDGGGRDSNPSDPGDWTSGECGSASNSSWHGTHVAGT
ncbi:MAG: peptidase S8, partial [Gammaproteobacteria bacterium]|nr:peptidase S8 [Gammaproteobacteria bacterium]